MGTEEGFSMKLEIGESLGYSYLRHVQRCWLVQANWKASEHWDKRLTDDELEQEFGCMRERLESLGGDFKETFKQNKCSQFLRQAEIDVVGVGLDGSIWTVEVAFHEGGLNYGDGTDKNVLKKMLRTMLVLRAYHREDTRMHVCFASPRVGPKTQMGLEKTFVWLRREYPAINWRLMTNDCFTDRFLRPLREKTSEIKDTSELFVRSLQLLELIGSVKLGREK